MNEKCKTKYPLMMVHGAGFRDRKYLGYWGRIPKALENEGAAVSYGNQESFSRIEQNAVILQQNIAKLICEAKVEKINVIAHSKGGLEMRYLISSLGMSEQIASLTMISTPNRGSKTMSLLWKLPDVLFKIVAWFANLFFRLLGDNNPDFYFACKQFTQEYIKDFNEKNPDVEGVYYQSYATVMKNSFSDLLLFFPHWVVRMIEGENDGLVTPRSAKWANFKGICRGASNRGISHADAVDLRRRCFTKKGKADGISDIKDVYIKMVSELKQMGF